MAIFDFEWICVEDEFFMDTETTIWTGKHIPTAVLISSNLIHELIFLWNPIPLDLLSSSIEVLENLATQRKPQSKLNVFRNETTIKSSVARVLETVNQRRSQRVGIEAEDDTSKNSSTQFLQ